MLIVNPLTAIAFFEIAKKEKHAAIINNAAAGALGRMILRLGQTEHLPVTHIVRRQAQVGLLRSLGAEYILNNTDPDFYAQLRLLAQQLKATLILDPVGGEQTQRLLDAAPSGSTVVAYGALSGRKRDMASGISNDPSKNVIGFFMPDWLAKKNRLQALWNLKRVQQLVANELKTEIQKRFPLSHVKQALELYQTNATAGKVLLLASES
jgi:NADPH:quinone reductase-like Zn-dependent oxidoreductase